MLSINMRREVNWLAQTIVCNSQVRQGCHKWSVILHHCTAQSEAGKLTHLTGSYQLEAKKL